MDEGKSVDYTRVTSRMDVGYKVFDIYEVWHWKEQRKGLFAEYINEFLKEKMEPSGWPSICYDEETKNAFEREV